MSWGGLRMLMPALLNEDVDPAEPPEHLRGGPLDLVGLGDVGGHGQGLDPVSSASPGGGRGRLLGVAADDRRPWPRPAARPRAIPRPIPPLPPVTMATLPVRSKRFTVPLAPSAGV